MVTDDNDFCSYQYEHLMQTDPDDIVEISRPPETVKCPHTASDPDIDTCLFHGIDEEYPQDKATESFLAALEDNPGTHCFAGAYLPGLDLAGKTITTANERPLDLRGAIIDGEIDLTDAHITVPVILDGASVMGAVTAENAVFERPVSLVDTAFQKGLHWQGATIREGIVANNINATYVDWRDISIEGPVSFRQGSFLSSLKLSRGDIDGKLLLSEAKFNWHIDGTMLSVTGDLEAENISVDGDIDLVGFSTGGSFLFQNGRVGGDLNCDHAVIQVDLQANRMTVNDTARFEDVRVLTGDVRFDQADIGGKADFGSMDVAQGSFTATEAMFAGEIWFTHAKIADTTDVSRATLRGDGHLRDAYFKGDLIYRDVDDTETQTWMAGSVIDGDIDARDTEFDYFQFTATVRGNADFSNTEYASRALFSSSTFEGDVWFDEAVFTGTPDFSESQFTGTVSFTDTEFMVEPTFEDARFTADPNLDDANFLTDISASLEERYRQWEVVLVHPKSLANTNLSIPESAVNPNFSVPVSLTHLAEDVPAKTKTVIDALLAVSSQDWYTVVNEALQVARTAATQLDTLDGGWLVFGMHLGDSETPADGFFEDIQTAGVYERTEDGFQFTHLAPSLAEVDYLIPIPATDTAFEAEASVATRSEIKNAMLRHERYRLRDVIRNKRAENKNFDVHHAVVPVLIGAGQI